MARDAPQRGDRPLDTIEIGRDEVGEDLGNAGEFGVGHALRKVEPDRLDPLADVDAEGPIRHDEFEGAQSPQPSTHEGDEDRLVFRVEPARAVEEEVPRTKHLVVGDLGQVGMLFEQFGDPNPRVFRGGVHFGGLGHVVGNRRGEFGAHLVARPAARTPVLRPSVGRDAGSAEHLQPEPAGVPRQRFEFEGERCELADEWVVREDDEVEALDIAEAEHMVEDDAAVFVCLVTRAFGEVDAQHGAAGAAAQRHDHEGLGRFVAENFGDCSE